VTILASDNLNRTESPIASPWVNVAAGRQLSLNGSAATGIGTDECCAYYTGPTWPNDQYSKVTYGTQVDGDDGPAVRCNNSSGGNFYFLSCYGDDVYLDKLVNGAHSSVAQDTGSPGAASGIVAELRAVGTTITCIVNGTTFINTTDGSLSAGSAGIYSWGGGGNYITDWEGGDFGSTQSYSYTGSGGMTLSGAAAKVKVRALAAAGGATFGGASTVAKKRTYTPSGGLQHGGAATAARARACSAAGGCNFAGAAARAKIKVAAGVGGVVFAGSAPYSTSGTQQYSYTASGGATLSGASACVKKRVAAAAGGFAFGGAAAMSSHEARRTVVAAGGLNFGGAASISTFSAGAGADPMRWYQQRIGSDGIQAR